MARELKRTLVVEDDDLFRRSLVRLVASWGSEVAEARTVADARVQLADVPTLVITDVRLPDGSGSEVARTACEMRPAPLVVALSGEASAEEAFELAQIGVRAYFAKPVDPEELTRGVRQVMAEAPRLDGLIATTVGQKPLRSMQDDVRRVMIEQALAITEGSRTDAARLLEITRQGLQHILRSMTRPRHRVAKAPRRGRPSKKKPKSEP